MAKNPRSEPAKEVWIADDGELTDVRKLLDGLGVAWESMPRPEAGSGQVEFSRIRELPCSLLFTTAAHAVTLQPSIVRSDALHVVVLDEVPRTVRRALERAQCDFVLQRPIHAGVLRLLVTHALYAGPEKRRVGRVLIGEPVTFKAGLLSKNATLIELSEGGCSLQARQPVETGTSIQLTLPKKLTGTKPTLAEGRVVSRVALAGDKANHRISIAFTAAASIRRELRAILRARSKGATALHEELAAGGSLKLTASRRKRVQPPRDEPLHAPELERRRHPRKRYRKRVLATGGGRARTLIGADLSLSGMRVGFDPDLIVGEELKLAIYGNAGQAPVVVRAEVVRGSDTGFGLAFRNVGDKTAGRLEQMVRSLPAVPSSRPDKPGLVMSEILDEDDE